jgi:hypothetical protein
VKSECSEYVRFNFHHKVKSTGFQPVSLSHAHSWPRLSKSRTSSRKGLPKAGSEEGGLPVPCDPREPTYFSRWLFSPVSQDNASLLLPLGTAFRAYNVWFPGCVWCPACFASLFRLTCGQIDQLTDQRIEFGIELTHKSKAQASHFGFHLCCNDFWHLASIHPGHDLRAKVINDPKPAITTGKAPAHGGYFWGGVAVTENFRIPLANQIVKFLSHGVSLQKEPTARFVLDNQIRPFLARAKTGTNSVPASCSIF